MNEFEHRPTPEQLEKESLIAVIREYLLDDKDYLLSAHPDMDDLRMAVDATLLGEGYDPDKILLQAGEYADVRYKSDNSGDT